MSNPYHEKENTVQYFRAFLCETLNENKGQAYASESAVTPDDVEQALRTFDRIARFGGTGEAALQVALGSINMQNALSGAAGYIARQLANLPKDKTVEGNSLRRLREIFRKMQADVSKCSVNINGIDYTREACEAALSKLKLPAGLESWDYTLTTATASTQDKFKLVLKVIA